MRILLLTQYFEPEVGASQVRLSAVCRELLAAGHEVEVVTAMPNHPAGRIFSEYRRRFYVRELREGVTVHRVWLFAAGGTGAKRIVNYLSFAFLSLFGMLRAQKPDYVFADSPPLFLAMPGWICSRFWKVPLIFNVADLWPDSVLDLGVMREGFATRIGFALEKWTYRHATFITAVTEGIREALIYNKKVPPAKILFLPNGVDTKMIRPAQAPDEQLRAKLGLQGKKIVLYAGNHGYASGLDQLLEAASFISNVAIHFVLVGDGPEKSRLRALARVLDLENVSFLDAVPLEELPALLSITDIAAVTLRKSRVTHGARSAKALVMMAAGKPIVLAAEGETADLIREADAGVIVPPHKPRELADAILSLIANPELAAKKGTNGRTFVQGHFDWSLLVQNWLAQLSGAIPSSSPMLVARRQQNSTADTPTS